MSVIRSPIGTHAAVVGHAAMRGMIAGMEVGGGPVAEKVHEIIA
jgi:hypothetical protein